MAARRCVVTRSTANLVTWVQPSEKGRQLASWPNVGRIDRWFRKGSVNVKTEGNRDPDLQIATRKKRLSPTPGQVRAAVEKTPGNWLGLVLGWRWGAAKWLLNGSGG